MINFLTKLFDMLLMIFDYKSKIKDNKSQKDKLKIEELCLKKINKVVDCGTLDDILNLKIIIFAILMICGCSTTNVEITTTKSWENHYYTVEQFKNGTKDISLDNDQSIWVLSNTTLKKILKEVREKNHYEQ